jgi:transposase
MAPVPPPLAFCLLLFCGWVNRNQQAVIDYLLEENRVLRAVNGSRRLRLKVARMLRRHRPLILNWFRARGEISAGIVEGFNNKAKLTSRKAYGFRSYHCLEIALYHTLAQLPEPETTHRFC